MRGSFEKEKEWRKLLKKVGENLLSADIKALLFLIALPAGEEESLIKDGFDVLMKLQAMGTIDMESPDTLIAWLESIYRKDLIRHVDEFKNKCNMELRRLSLEAEQEKSKLTSSRGFCLILSNQEFSINPNTSGTESNQKASEGMAVDESPKQAMKYDRPYTVDDEVSLEKTFRWLNFDVEIERNCTAAEFKTKVSAVLTRDHAKYDAFVFCILTHGYFSDKEGAVLLGTDWEPKPLSELRKSLRADLERRSFLDKPKIFFVQALSDKNVVPRAVMPEQAKVAAGSSKSRATESDDTQESKLAKSEEEKKSTESGGGQTRTAAESMDEEAPNDKSSECSENALLGTAVLTENIAPQPMEQQAFDGDINARNGFQVAPENSRRATRSAPKPRLPALKNFISLISTTAEPTGSTKKGSSFISTLCDVFKEKASNEDLFSMLKSVQRTMVNKKLSMPKFIENHSFSKIYFNPRGPFTDRPDHP